MVMTTVNDDDNAIMMIWLQWEEPGNKSPRAACDKEADGSTPLLICKYPFFLEGNKGG